MKPTEQSECAHTRAQSLAGQRMGGAVGRHAAARICPQTSGEGEQQANQQQANRQSKPGADKLSTLLHSVEWRFIRWALPAPAHLLQGPALADRVLEVNGIEPDELGEFVGCTHPLVRLVLGAASMVRALSPAECRALSEVAKRYWAD